jgi:hypothetical protein
MSCCNLLATVRQLCSDSLSARCVLTSARNVHRLTLPGTSFRLNLPAWVVGTQLPVLLCQTDLRCIVWWTFSSTRDRNSSGRPSLLNDDSLDDFQHVQHFQHLTWYTVSTFSDFRCNLFFDKENMYQEWVAWFFNQPVWPKYYNFNIFTLQWQYLVCCWW